MMNRANMATERIDLKISMILVSLYDDLNA